jgi:hypothetical protein
VPASRLTEVILKGQHRRWPQASLFLGQKQHLFARHSLCTNHPRSRAWQRPGYSALAHAFTAPVRRFRRSANKGVAAASVIGIEHW